MKYYIRTYGCQMNVADSFVIEMMLGRMNYSPATEPEDADLVILNTCCVREHAERRALTNLASLRRMKIKKPETIIVLAGCAAQLYGDSLLKKYPHLDIVLGTRNMNELPASIKKVSSSGERITAVDMKDGGNRCPFACGETYPLKVFVPVMTGCNNYCSYCIVPYVRGKETCIPEETIIAEIKKLVSGGCREATLLGQNITAYKNGNTDFADLLCAVSGIEGLERIRFLTSHPENVNDKLIKTIKKTKKLCEHFHIPLQSGSDRILKSMNRKYTGEEYCLVVEKIREYLPDSSITTDFIVGYPTETEEDFGMTLAMAEKIKFDAAYVFKYSARPLTRAAALKDDVPLRVKEERLGELNSLCERISLQKNLSLVGKNEEVLVEEWNEKHKKLSGKTRTYKHAYFEGKEELIGGIASVRINEAYAFSLYGKLLD